MRKTGNASEERIPQLEAEHAVAVDLLCLPRHRASQQEQRDGGAILGYQDEIAHTQWSLANEKKSPHFGIIKCP